MKKITLLVLVLAGCTLLKGADTKQVPDGLRYHLQAVEAQMQTVKTQQALLQVQYQKLDSDLKLVDAERQQVLLDIFTSLGCKKDECSLDETKWEVSKLKK